MTVLNKFKELDHKLFMEVNGKWHNLFLDNLLPFTREPQLWVPFYCFLILFAVINFKKRGFYWVLCFALTISLTNYISSTLIKEAVLRLRPCQDPLMIGHVRLLVNGCPGNPSFPSSHAVNHFAVAMFVFTTYKNPLSRWWILLFFWAAIISYAQVYVGVHFPVDVTCGAIIGCFLGYWPAILYNNRLGLSQAQKSLHS